MNKNGQVFFYTFMIGLVIIVLALALSPGLREQVDTARNPSNLDCGNSSISTFNKATCFVTDTTLFYFIGGLIFIAGTIIGARIVFSNE